MTRAESPEFILAYHQFSANENFLLSSIQRETSSSIERRFSVHSPMLSFCKELTYSKYKPISACVRPDILKI